MRFYLFHVYDESYDCHYVKLLLLSSEQVDIMIIRIETIMAL